jgi:hypothetical protein
MYFKQFNRKLSEDATGNKIVEQLRSNGHLIEKTEDDQILIDGIVTELTELEEARKHIKTKYETLSLEQEIKSEIYEELSDNKIVDIINKHHDVKVTDTLIESYLEFASSKLFTLDPVVEEIRNLNKLDTLVEGKIDYTLADNSVVAINHNTQDKLRDLFQSHTEVIEHMRQTKENFISVLNQIGEK